MTVVGMRVVVTRAKEQAPSLGRALAAAGAHVVYVPAIAIADPSSWDELDRALELVDRGEYDWIAFPSANAVDRFFRRLRVASAGLGGAQVAAVGRATARALDRRGASPDLVPDEFTMAALADALGSGPGRVLIPRAQDAPPLPTTLASRGWSVEEVPAYRNERAARTPAHDVVEAGDFDAIVFMSPSAVDGLLDAVAHAGLGLAGDEDARRIVACIGPSTAAAARRRGLRVDVVPDEHTAQGLIDALRRVPSAS